MSLNSLSKTGLWVQTMTRWALISSPELLPSPLQRRIMSENFSLNKRGEMANRSSRASSSLPWLSAGRVRVCLSFSASDGSSVAPELGVGGHVDDEDEDDMEGPAAA